MRRACTDVEWFEDYRVGDEFICEPVVLTEKEIIDFASAYDPQSMHIDPIAAKSSPFQGIIASGTHLFAAVWGGMMRPGFLNGRGVGGTEMNLQFFKPVHPGDTLTILSRVTETAAFRSRPDRGLVSFESSVTNQKGDLVMTLRFKHMVLTHPK